MSAILHRDLRKNLAMLSHGEGVYLVDTAGKRYLDASGGAGVSCLGHSHPKVIAAIREQLGKLAHAHTSFFTNEPSERLARHLIDRAPAGFGAGRAIFVGSGSEAMEVTLKLVRQYFLEKGEPQRERFVARDMAYHGNTLGALAVGGHAQRRLPYQPLLMDVGRVPACYAYRQRRDGESEAAYSLRVADTLEDEIRRLGPERVAAFVVEPVVGATLGCATATPGYFARIREICDRHGVLLVADEVMCGMGRTGTLFAMEQEGVCPDIVTIAKGLGAGYQPIAAVLASERVVDALLQGSGALANGHTYMAHAAACAGALAVLEAIEEEKLLDNVVHRGRQLRAALDQRFGQHANVGDIRGRGLFQALELVADRDSKEPFPAAAKLAVRFKQKALENGLVCYPSMGCVDGVRGDHVLLAPPYIIDESHIDEIVDKLGRTLDACLAET